MIYPGLEGGIFSAKAEVFHRKRLRPVANATRQYDSDTVFTVSLFGANGVKGIGCSRIRKHEAERSVRVFQGLYPLICGSDGGLSHDLFKKSIDLTVFQILSAADIALWDLKAKRLELPMYRLFVEEVRDMEIYAMCGYYEEGKGLKELDYELRAIAGEGVKAFKVKIGALPFVEDLARIRVAREAIGDSALLMVDANGVLSLEQAKIWLTRLADFNVFWFEEPVASDVRALEVYGDLRCEGGPLIAGGESLCGWRGFLPFIRAGAFDVVQPDATVMGGFSEGLKVVAAAESEGLMISPHGSHLVHSHFLAMFSKRRLLEYFPYDLDPLKWLFHSEGTVISDGYVRVTESPGLGLEFTSTAQDFCLLRTTCE